MRVRWLEAMYGLRSGQGHVAVAGNARGRLEQMAAQLAGTEDLVAIYVPEGTEEHYDVGDMRGRVVGAVRLLEMPDGRSVEDYPIPDWDENDGNPDWNGDWRWPIGWPCRTVLIDDPANCPNLRSLVQVAHGAAAFGSYTAQFQLGPIRLGHQMAQALQQALVHQYGPPPWPDTPIE